MTITALKTTTGYGTIQNTIVDHLGVTQTLDNNILDATGTLVLLFRDQLFIVPSRTSRQLFHTTDNRKFIVITKDPDLICQPLDEFCATKDPGEVLDYTIDYSAVLIESDPPDSIIASTWTLELSLKETTLVITDDSLFTGIDATVWVSGGSVTGLKHKLINHIVCASGRQYERTIILRIRSK